jgi:hypothetical protein
MEVNSGLADRSSVCTLVPCLCHCHLLSLYAFPHLTYFFCLTQANRNLILFSYLHPAAVTPSSFLFPHSKPFGFPAASRQPSSRLSDSTLDITLTASTDQQPPPSICVASSRTSTPSRSVRLRPSAFDRSTLTVFRYVFLQSIFSLLFDLNLYFHPITKLEALVLAQ